MSPSTITSAAVSPVRIVGGGFRMESVPAAALPIQSLGLGPFTAAAIGHGMAKLLDSSGQSWGTFASEALAQATASALSQ